MIAFNENASKWQNVSRSHPCPVCEKPDWCSITGDPESPEAVVCMRIKSDNQRRNNGWLHQLSQPVSGFSTTNKSVRRKKSQPTIKNYSTHAEALAAWERHLGKASAVYLYQDAESKTIGIVARWDRNGDKTIRQASRQATGQWAHKAMQAPKPLYRLPEIDQFKESVVYVVEGEKCAEALIALGLTATTWSGGSSAVGKTDFSSLAGRDVVLLADKDEAGQKAMDAVTAQLSNLQPQPKVRRVDLPGLPTKGDVVDWIACHEDLEEPNTPKIVVQNLQELVNETEPVELSDFTKPANSNSVQESGAEPSLLCMSEVHPQPVRWLWPGRFAAGRISLLVGMPGAGKSFLTCDMAARISKGKHWPDGKPCKQGSVLFITAEDDPHDTIRPRLDAHAADATHIHLLKGIKRSVDANADVFKNSTELMFSLDHIDILRQTLERLPDCRLIVIDPIGSFLGGRTDAHRDNEVRAILAPVAMLAEQHGTAVLIVAHRRKGNATHADDMALGSRAFTGIARSVWHLSVDRESNDRRLLLPGKANLAPDQGGLAFTIEGEPAQIQWEQEPVKMNADEALARETSSSSGEMSALDEAVAWLQVALRNGPRSGNELKRAAHNDGISGRTLERAKGRLRVENGPNGFGGPWVWRLPEKLESIGPTSHRQESSESAKENILAKSGKTVTDSAGIIAAKPFAALKQVE